MSTTAEIRRMNTTRARTRQWRLVRVILAAVAILAMLALFDAARPDTTQNLVRLTDMAFDVPAPTSGPVGLQYPQAPPNLSGGRGFAIDDDGQAQQQELQDMLQMQQSEQQAEQENEQAQQQAQLDEQMANQ
jgi:hypothetical protein